MVKRLRSSLIVEDGCGHFVMEKSLGDDETGRTPKPNMDKTFQRASRLVESKVNERQYRWFKMV